MNNDIMAALAAANELYENAEEISGYTVHPAGPYIARVDEAILEIHKDKGHVQMVLKLVTDEGSIRQWIQLSNFVSEKQASYSKNVLRCLGFEGDLKELGEKTTAVLLGNEVAISVKVETYEGITRNNVFFQRFVGAAEFQPTSGFEGQFSAATSNDDDDFPEGF